MRFSKTHPYQRVSFWMNPSNQYWERSEPTEESKRHHRDWLKRMIKEDKAKPFLNNSL